MQEGVTQKHVWITALSCFIANRTRAVRFTASKALRQLLNDQTDNENNSNDEDFALKKDLKPLITIILNICHG